MKRFFKRIMGMNTVKLYCVTLLCHFVWSFVVGAILYLSGANFSQHVASSSDFVNSFLLVPMCALVEEMLFRWLPMLAFFASLGLLVKHVKVRRHLKLKIEKWGIIVVVLATSVVFGVVHGNVFNILLQGVSGLIFFMFYLRSLYKERAKGTKDRFQLKPLLSSTLYHFTSNSILIAL